MTDPDKSQDWADVKAAELPPDKWRSHLVLLGAGASRQALPDGDRHGKPLPLMNDLIPVLGLEDLTNQTGKDWQGKNFEAFYADLYSDKGLADIRREIEKQIFNYFEHLELPDHATIYDVLVLSLREKDTIATFNWDPFLVQALRRNSNLAKPPRVLFLHGNVSFAYRFRGEMDIQVGPVKPGQRGFPAGWARPPILFPVTQKNYQQDPFIDAQWKMMADEMRRAFVFTIFGYGAPATDVEAVRLMKTAWGDVEKRQFEEVEFIDIRDEGELRELWRSFIHTHHFQATDDFFDCILTRAPRRSIEGMRAQLLDAKFVELNQVPRGLSLSDLQDWFTCLVDVELAAEEGDQDN